MRAARAGVLALGLLVLSPAGTARAEREILVTPFAGYLFGGSLQSGYDNDVAYIDESAGFGVIFDLLDEPRAHHELLYSFRRTELSGIDAPDRPERSDLDVHYLHVGGTYEFPQERLRPFVAGGLGLTALVPDGGDLDSGANFSLSLGGGVRFPLSEKVLLRLEARGFLTILADSTEIFCASSGGGGGCAAGTHGDTFGQVLLLAGISFAL